jgi:antitoxin HigA-1
LGGDGSCKLARDFRFAGPDAFDFEPLGLSITDAAALGVTQTRYPKVNEKRGISPEMAVRLSKVFGGSAESWLVQQAQYDLDHVRADRMKLKRLELA